jgi:murein DD-endopeptidase MepM/ murein hydrolase activator NlpD
MMQIIVVSSRFSKAISLTISTTHAMLGLGALTLLVLLLSGSLSYVTLRHAAELNVPFLKEVVAGVQEEENRKTQDVVRDSIKAIASKVGQLQAQLLHLDTLGERLSSVAGIKPADVAGTDARQKAPEATSTAVGGKGGPLVSSFQYRMSAEELGYEVDRLLKRAEFQADYLSVVESNLMEAKLAHNSLPTILPVQALWSASAYGWRTDPFTGQRAMHEGVDFSAEVGTPIRASANGVVIASEKHPEYGNMIEIDHGNGYTTRYAHASVLVAQSGQLVKRGQRIAEVGNTGRSTGPHLHFEVRYKGASVNPARFLPRAGNTSVEFARR